jgi:hypothetical protein
MTNRSSTAAYVRAVELLRDVNLHDLEAVVQALTISESEVADLCDSLAKSTIDAQSLRIGRPSARTHDSERLFA